MVDEDQVKTLFIIDQDIFLSSNALAFYEILHEVKSL